MRISDWSSDVCSSDLLADPGLVRPGLGEEAEHQRRRERPRLRGEVAAAKDAHAAFLEHLAFDGLLQRLARLDEARSEERRVGKECVGTCRSRWWPCH